MRVFTTHLRHQHAQTRPRPERTRSIVRQARWLLLLAFIASAAAAALADNSGQPVLGLYNADDAQHLGGYWSVLRDPGGSLSVGEVRSEAIAARFVPLQQDTLSLGFTSDVVWLRFQVRNLNPDIDDWLLEFDYPLLDDLRVNACDLVDGRPVACTSVHTGDAQPYVQRPLPHRTFLLPMTFHGDQVKQYHVRIQTTSSLLVRPAIHTASAFFHHESSGNILFGMVYGFMLLMAIYNTFLFMAVRDLAYLAYVFAVLSGTLFIMTINGHAAQYLWPENPAWANTIAPLSASLWVLGTLVFTQLFLETRRYSIIGWRAINGLLVLAVGGVLVSLLADYSVAVKISSVLGLLVGALIPAVSILCWWRGNRAARYFTFAWAAYGLGTTFMILNRMGMIESSFFTYHSATLGLVGEIIILSLAMSDKYRLMREELAEHSRGLEAKVVERTAEIEAVNEQLREMAQRDSLTRLANRRMFDSSLSSEWERHRRESHPLALVLIDIDHFKALNDHFGHPQGDQCLKQVATAMSASLQRPADIAARYGGDEFALILPETDTAGAVMVAERISEAVNKLAIEQAPTAASDIITLSIGVVSRIPPRGMPLEALIELADKALYQAKDRGRAQIAVSPAKLVALPDIA